MFYDKFMCADGTEMKMENKYFHISGAFSSLRRSWRNSLEHTLKWIEAHLQPISWLNFFLPRVFPPNSFRLPTKLSAAATQPQTYDTHTQAHDLLSNIIIIKSLILGNTTMNNKKVLFGAVRSTFSVHHMHDLNNIAIDRRFLRY